MAQRGRHQRWLALPRLRAYAGPKHEGVPVVPSVKQRLMDWNTDAAEERRRWREPPACPSGLGWPDPGYFPGRPPGSA
jgi:hypothetical protein